MFKVVVLLAFIAVVYALPSPVQINAAEPSQTQVNPAAEASEHDTVDLERSESKWGWGLNKWGWGYPIQKVHYYPVHYPKVYYYPIYYTHAHEHHGHHEHHEHHDHHEHYDHGHASHYNIYPVHKKWWW